MYIESCECGQAIWGIGRFKWKKALHHYGTCQKWVTPIDDHDKTKYRSDAALELLQRYGFWLALL